MTASPASEASPMSSTPSRTGARAPLPVVLAGARGHGRWHVANIRRLQDEGLVRLVGICELTPLTEEEFGGGLPEQSADFGALLESTGARIAIVCTPIPTHADLALAAAERGVHLLLEKPPAPSYAEFRRMADGIAAAGVACQIGFQSLGSHAVPAIRELVAEGAIGRTVGIGGGGGLGRGEGDLRRGPPGGRGGAEGAPAGGGAPTHPPPPPPAPPPPPPRRPRPRPRPTRPAA